MVSGVAVAIFMTPADVVSTRLYNQSIDSSGKGSLYAGPVDCLVQVLRTEGVLGIYKGIGANYLRVGPHSVIMLSVWTLLREMNSGKTGAS